jgi:predicted dienelactone hydrolase
MGVAEYDPFARGPFPVGTRTVEAADVRRGRVFPCEIWYPAGGAGPGPGPLVVFSHYAGGHRRTATFLCTHLASHGYVAAAVDHSEVVAAELAARAGETPGERRARIDAVIGSRVPDVRFLLDYLLDGQADGVFVDARRVGLAGHSLGGWTVLATPESDPRVRAVVAMAPGGSSRPRPGVLPLPLTFAWGRDVPVLYLAAEDDVPVPVAGVRELFDRTPATKQMVILRHADHQHFADDVEASHEALRAMTLPG